MVQKFNKYFNCFLLTFTFHKPHINQHQTNLTHWTFQDKVLKKEPLPGGGKLYIRSNSTRKKEEEKELAKCKVRKKQRERK